MPVFCRNVVIALGNSGDRSAIGPLEIALRSRFTIVRGAAVWALGRLCTQDEGVKFKREYRAREIDAETIEEWEDAFPEKTPDSA